MLRYTERLCGVPIMTRSHRSREGGFTLIELMIGLLIGLIVLSGATYIFVITVKSSRDVMYSARLNQELAAAVSIITGDIRRAGHWVQNAGNSSPYGEIGNDFFVVSANCVLYNYDEDGNSSIEADEFRGVKLLNSTLELKTSGTDMDDCTTGQWDPITDINFMTVTSAVFSDVSSCTVDTVSAACPGTVGTSDVASVRELSITISAQVNGDASWQKTVQETVKLRNDFYAH